MDSHPVAWSSVPNGILISILVVAYVIALLVMARRADRVRFQPGRNILRGISYALSLSVLCTSWTYFGAVGLAMRSGWGFLPNSLGPIIALTLLWPVWRRIAIASKSENASSIADFIASRYGKSRLLGALIACVAIVGALPYISLQMMALSKATTIILGGVRSPLATQLLVVILMGLSIVFGTRRPTLTQHNRGLSRVVAIESVVKLAALIAVGGLALFLLRTTSQTPRWGALGRAPMLNSSFLISTILCTVTMFTLPRVFHLGFVTFEEISDLKIGRWLFPTYMLVWTAAIVPIAIAGATVGGMDPDVVVLSLPLHEGGSFVAAFAFLGGFSAGAAMVMVETIALSAMISNELILPWLAQKNWAISPTQDVGPFIVTIRRYAIVGILALSYLYFVEMPPNVDIPHLGFASLAASAQLFPALLGSVFWRRGHAHGAISGIVAGMFVWLTTIAAPQLGFDGISASHLLGNSAASPLFEVGVCLSLAVNLAAYVGVSLLSRERLIDKIQANAFLMNNSATVRRGDRDLNATVGDLRALLQRFLGSTETALGLAAFGRHSGHHLRDDDPVTPSVARLAEKMLAGAIGASSARNVIALSLAGEERDASNISHILDEAAHAVHFSREIVHTAFNAIDQGISVVDRDLRLVAWNERYVELFKYPVGEVYVGKPLAELIGLSALRAQMSELEKASAIEERIGPMRRRERQHFDREWPSGVVIRVVGRPLSTGEYITSFTDVTEIRAASRSLSQVNEDLERRVQSRTRELTEVNSALAEAKALADRVVSAQNRFVAAASHDLIQPMHAARLYIEAARDGLGDTSPRISQLLDQADYSTEAADRLLKALLYLSKIEVGGIDPTTVAVDLGWLLAALAREFQPIAAARDLRLVILPTGKWALSDPDLLRSVLQNLVSNAIRYTPAGGCVLVCARSEGTHVRIEVRDNGPGIAHEAKELVFGEYTRLPETSGEVEGTGLGLAIARRICVALKHQLSVRSAEGRGTVFSVALLHSEPIRAANSRRPPAGSLEGLRVLCVEDKTDVLRAQCDLLVQWGATVTSARSVSEALDGEPSCDVVIADYHLGQGRNGLDLCELLGPQVTHKILLTANTSEGVKSRAERLQVTVLSKPANPASLRSFLIHAAQIQTKNGKSRVIN